MHTNTHNISVEDESHKYEDVIQIDKINYDYDYYSSCKFCFLFFETIQIIMMLRWINDCCTLKPRRSSHIDLPT
ncbi:unnamed protein product [Rotaria sp. Silwood2]|nr:unnamed protein product [Rotaria sp. Silwood2]